MRYFVTLFFVSFCCYANMPLGDFQKYPNYYFVETGTFGGQGIKNAVIGEPFTEYHTIEINKDDYLYAMLELGRYPSVHCYLGNSIDRLSAVIAKLDKPITFWLDAHVYPPKMGIQNCPLMEELEAIKNHPIKTHTILIDDMSCCGTLAFDYITYEDILAKILTINPSYQFKLVAGGDDGSVAENILVAYLDEEQGM